MLKPNWKEAKIKEMRALGKNDKAELVHLPYGKKVDVNGFSQLNTMLMAQLKDKD